MLMAVLPCMMNYIYILRKIADEPDTSKSQYWDFIQDYADDKYCEDCISWGKFADCKCENLTENEKNTFLKFLRKQVCLNWIFGK